MIRLVNPVASRPIFDHAGRSVRALLVALVAVALGGCPADPYDPNTWIEKLDNPAELDQAITELQRLKDPVAVKPLAEAWEKQNRPQKILRVVIELAERTDNGGPHWEHALPVLRTAVDEFDVNDQRSIDTAVMAADALGNAKDKESVPILIRAINKSMPNISPGQRVRLAAISAIGKIGNDPRAVDALLAVLKKNPADQPPQLFAAAALALAEARSESAIVPLLEAMFKIPPIFPQVRRALVATGKPAIDALIQVFQGKQSEVNAIAKENKFNIDCKKGMGAETSCVAPSNLEYKSALLLGDFYDKKPVAMLVQGLKSPAMPSFFEGPIPGPTQHTAILDALKKIGDQSVAAEVLAYATAADTDDAVRPLAVDTYSWLTTDTSGLPALAKLIKDDDAEEQVRLAAGVAYGRLARDEKDYEPLTYMVERYKKEADKNQGAAQKAREAFEKAEAKFHEANKKFMEKQDDKKLEEAKDKAQAEMDDKLQESSLAEGQVAGYRNFQRTFEQNIARAHAAVMCKKDPQCYMGLLDKDPAEIGKQLSKYIKDLDKWSDEEKASLKVATVERALVEISKLGEGARPVADKALEKIDSKDRVIRQGLLLVLVRGAQLPCDKCVERLNAVIKDQKDDSTLDPLTVETEVVRNYFLWAGK